MNKKEKKRLLDRVIAEWIDSKNMNLRQTLFTVVASVGGILGFVALLETLILNGCSYLLIPEIMQVILFGGASYISLTGKKQESVIIIVGLLFGCIEFPLMFFFSGGLEGGASVWFVLSFVYIFLMYTGWKLLLFCSIQIMTTSGVFLYAYMYPESIVPMQGQIQIYADSIFAIVGAGITIGVLLHFQTSINEKERILVEQKNEELKQASKSQNAFFTSMSHEIRTPINSVIGLNEMILRTSKDDDVCEYARNVQISSKMLLALINDILDFAQLEQNRMQIIPMEYSVEELFRDMVHMMHIRMQEKKLDFIVDVDPNTPARLVGDPKRIEQVVINLLTNAVKYTNEGSVTLEVTCEPVRENTVRMIVSVKDTGIGIRKEDLTKLYDVFSRVDSVQNLKTEGSGLGLSITKQLVTLMGGDVTVDSIYTKGSIFTIQIEQQVAGPQTIGRVDFIHEALKINSAQYKQLFEAPEARVLLVDDNEMNGIVAKNLLLSTKVQVDVVKSGAECIASVKEKYYHVILMDYLMPDMNGAETLKVIRNQNNGLCRNTPVILMTANIAADARRVAEENGFDSYLEKPIQSEKLEQEILNFLPEELIEYQKPLSKEAAQEAMGVVTHHRRKKKLLITTDSVSDIPKEMLEYYDIHVASLYIRTDKGRFADTQEIVCDNLPSFISGDVIHAKADSLSVEEYENFYASQLTRAENIIHISMAAYAGKSYGVAVTAAKSFDHVHVIDSGQISCGEGMLAIYAAYYAKEGYSMDYIIDIIEKRKGLIKTKFILPNINAFYQNGYTNKLTAALCRMVNAKPILSMSKSSIGVSGITIGKMENCWKYYIHKTLRMKRKIDTSVVYITYTNLTIAQLEMIKQEILKCVPFSKVIVNKASVSTFCNAGVYTFGFSYVKKTER